MFWKQSKNQSPQALSDDRFYFDEPRLRMTIAGRLFVRVSSRIGYLVLAAGAFTFVLSDIARLRALGSFLFLFLGDRALHWREADKPFSEMPRTGRVNLSRYISPAGYSVLEKAFDKSSIAKRNFFLEIMRELLDSREIQKSLRRLDIKPEEFKQKIEDFSESSRDEKTPADKSPRLLAEYSSSKEESDVPRGEIAADTRDMRRRGDKTALLQKAETLVLRAAERSIANNRRFIEPADFFSALFSVNDEFANRLFVMFSVDAGNLELSLLLSSLGKFFGFRFPSALGGFSFEPSRRIRHRIMNRAWTSRPTPTLDKFSVDFTDLARGREAGFLIGHEEEYRRLVDTLSRPLGPNALLIGEEGVGKKTIVVHLAQSIVQDEAPPAIFDKRLVGLEIASLVAGTSPEDLQQRLKRIVEEIFMAGNIILYIPDMHNLVKTSGSYYLSAADALMPVVKNNEFPVIGATYPREFKEFIEPRSDIAGIFEVIRINEISEAEAQKILAYESILFEKKTGITVGFAAVKTAVSLAKKYFSGKRLPSSAEELLKDALAIAERRQKRYLSPDEVIAAAEEKVNAPIHEARASEIETLLHLEDDIRQYFVNQEEAVRAVSDALREYRSGLSRRGGPIASFLFVGPTGVGKTELAKILARLQFGSPLQEGASLASGGESMIRFDMTEYQDKESFYRFIGSPDGNISGALTEAVLRKPYCLILLDEFEKAFPDILNLFLQVFDDGRLTDNLGRTVDFQNTVIIAASNAHSDIINDALAHGKTTASISEYFKEKLVDVFKPELLNRFSKIVVFKDLSPADVGKIAELNLNDLANTLDEQGIKLEFDASAVQQIAKLGYEPAFGARPLRRAIEENLRAPLAEKLLSKEVSRGGKIKAVFRDGRFQYVTVKE